MSVGRIGSIPPTPPLDDNFSSILALVQQWLVKIQQDAHDSNSEALKNDFPMLQKYFSILEMCDHKHSDVKYLNDISQRMGHINQFIQDPVCPFYEIKLETDLISEDLKKLKGP